MNRKNHLTLTALIYGALLALSQSISIAGEKSVSEKKADPAVYQGLRNQALNGTRKDFGLPTTDNTEEIWGVIMDITFDDGGSYTVVSIIDGNASIYLSNGGGYIGGIEHKSIHDAALTMVDTAEKYKSKMELTTKFPLPNKGYTTFYLLTNKGILTATALEDDLGEERHYLSPLFYAGQEIVTQYRMIDE